MRNPRPAESVTGRKCGVENRRERSRLRAMPTHDDETGHEWGTQIGGVMNGPPAPPARLVMSGPSAHPPIFLVEIKYRLDLALRNFERDSLGVRVTGVDKIVRIITLFE